MRKKSHYKIISLISSMLLPCLMLSSACATPKVTLTPQEKNYLLAEQAFSEGKFAEYNNLKNHLTQYPLYPYLEYRELQRSLDKRSNNEIEVFIKRYPDCPLSPMLKTQWLVSLAQKKQWNTFLSNYDQTNDLTLKCFYLSALENTGQEKVALDKTSAIWLTGHALPSACDAPTKYWLSKSPSRTASIWNRFFLSLEARNLGLANYMVSLLPQSDEKRAQQWLSLYRNPQQLSRIDEIKKTYSNKDMVAFGLAQLARYNVSSAAHLYPLYDQAYGFNHPQQQKVIIAIAQKYVYMDRSKAPYWLAKIDAPYANPEILEWRVRLALYYEDWPAVVKWINTLSTQQQQEHVWLYWKARALEASGNKKEADMIYGRLAKLRGYYPFLAAERIHAPISINHKKLSVTPQELGVVERNPGIIRAAEFYRLEQYQRGNREWWYAMEHMNEKQQYIAALLAQKWGWNDVSMKTTLKTAHKDDLELRYPLPFENLIKVYSQKTNLNKTMVYGLMRQESLFSSNAQSYVGARGLMQLMPGTAKKVAQQHNYKYYSAEQLFDPSMNIAMGTSYLNDLMNLYDRNPVLTTTAYNAGPHRVTRWLPKNKSLPADIWIENIPFKETRHYVKQVFTNAVIYQYRLGISPDISFLLMDVPRG